MSDDFNMTISIIKNMSAKKSITLSIIIVPNNLSIGMLFDFFRAAHLDISPALGIKRFVKYPIETAAIELVFEALYPNASISIIHLNPLFKYANAPKIKDNITYL